MTTRGTLGATLHLTAGELLAGLAHIRLAPADDGMLELIVRRPTVGEREVLEEGQLDVTDGLLGDTWKQRPSSRTPDGSPHPDCQINIMGARVIALLARQPDRRPLAGDQLFLDMDLSAANLPAGTRLAIGTAVLEVTAQPHTGCGKFVERFGLEAMRFVNSPAGRALSLRGINARVVQSGVVRAGDRARKLPGNA
jgi:hypothetical protein